MDKLKYTGKRNYRDGVVWNELGHMLGARGLPHAGFMFYYSHSHSYSTYGPVILYWEQYV